MPARKILGTHDYDTTYGPERDLDRNSQAEDYERKSMPQRMGLARADDAETGAGHGKMSPWKQLSMEVTLREWAGELKTRR